MTVETLQGPSGVTHLCVRGEVDIVSAGGLTDALTAATVGASAVILDLTAVTFFDSSGVRLVDRLARACGRNDAAFRVVAPKAGIARRVLDLVGLGDALASEDLESAVEALSGS